MKIHPVGADLCRADRRTDGQKDMSEVTVAFRNFPNAPKPCTATDKGKIIFNYSILLKGKAVPLQARRGPESSRKLRLPDFMTTAQDGSKVVNLTHRPPLPPGNAHGTHFC
jgi:hypothetical protein